MFAIIGSGAVLGTLVVLNLIGLTIAAFVFLRRK